MNKKYQLKTTSVYSQHRKHKLPIGYRVQQEKRSELNSRNSYTKMQNFGKYPNNLPTDLPESVRESNENDTNQ